MNPKDGPAKYTHQAISNSTSNKLSINKRSNEFGLVDGALISEFMEEFKQEHSVPNGKTGCFSGVKPV
jgi:hypothetical protein